MTGAVRPRSEGSRLGGWETAATIVGRGLATGTVTPRGREEHPMSNKECPISKGADEAGLLEGTRFFVDRGGGLGHGNRCREFAAGRRREMLWLS